MEGLHPVSSIGRIMIETVGTIETAETGRARRPEYDRGITSERSLGTHLTSLIGTYTPTERLWPRSGTWSLYLEKVFRHDLEEGSVRLDYRLDQWRLPYSGTQAVQGSVPLRALFAINYTG